MLSLRNVDIKFIKGIGPQRAELLKKELGITNAHDLVRHYPNSYIDRSTTYTTAQLHGEMPSIQLRGRFIALNTMGEGARQRLVGLFSDGHGTIEVTWFKYLGQIRRKIQTGTEYVIFGRPNYYERGRVWQMVHPEIDPADSPTLATGLRGTYPLTEKLRSAGIGSRQLALWIKTILEQKAPLHDTLPPQVIANLNLMPLEQALQTIHNPHDNPTLQRARERLKFEELFYIAVDMQRRNLQRKSVSKGLVFPRIGTFFNRFYNECLPFQLTGAQKRVLREIRADLATGRQMNRLVQGDVGSGKTLVALMAMLIALDNGAQACLMAPTEILATQHYETLRSMAAQIGINIQLLTGSSRKSHREQVLAGLADGSVHIIVGTHALIEDPVEFRQLGLAVIDEQHRFGVAQRARLWKKNPHVLPHVLVMTATPIPRTLAMTVYGDLDVSVIDELPPGRKPITTLLRFDNQRLNMLYGLGAEIRKGRQVYIVHPSIDDNDKNDLRSLEQGYEEICEVFPKLTVAFVHGRLKSQEKDYQMQLFASGQAQILVATTVIEVGVNVPNASVMVIENAERFGLSQLHQLRGRVGRGAEQSYCILMSKHNLGADTRKRLEIMTQTTDGFEIAEADMKLRGPGDIEGTMQSGFAFDLRIASLARDGQIVQLARQEAEALLNADPTLQQPQNQYFLQALTAQTNRTADWSQIS